MNVVFSSGPSLNDLLVSSSSCRPLCPREEQRKEVKKLRGRPRECRACEAGMVDGQCMLKNVVYSMSCAECGEVYVGETERPVRERFQEHFSDAKTLAVRSPWGAHYREFHKALSSDPHFRPFHRARIIAASSSLPSRRIKEAVSIERIKPEINQDSGWRLL